jgi:hypothetical protein
MLLLEFGLSITRPYKTKFVRSMVPPLYKLFRDLSSTRRIGFGTIFEFVLDVTQSYKTTTCKGEIDPIQKSRSYHVVLNWFLIGFLLYH